MLLLFRYDNMICFGFVCIRNNPSSRSSFRRVADECSNRDHQRRIIRIGQRLPMTAESSATAADNKEEEAPAADALVEVRPRVSKRRRVRNLAKILSSRLFSTFASSDNPLVVDTQSPSSPPPVVTGTTTEDEVAAIEMAYAAAAAAATAAPADEIITDQVATSAASTASSSSDDEIIVASTAARQSKAADSVDLSGSWTPVITSTFQNEYDAYLVNCGESFMFRKVVVNGIKFQKEVIRQLDDGVNLEITATNPAGNWNRTLITSDALEPMNATISDPDGDQVQVEAWWEDNGTKHKSILRGKPRVQGGVFETVRYLESNDDDDDGGDVLVCESSFIPNPSSSSSKFKYGHVVWKFKRI